MARLTATDPPLPLPFLCRMGLHAAAYSDTTGTEIAHGVWRLRTVRRCNRCHHETGPATFDVMADPSADTGRGET